FPPAAKPKGVPEAGEPLRSRFRGIASSSNHQSQRSRNSFIRIRPVERAMSSQALRQPGLMLAGLAKLVRFVIPCSYFASLQLDDSGISLDLLSEKNVKKTQKSLKQLGVTKVDEGFGITEYRLQNGLKVLLKENHSAPVASFMVVYKVGSRNEGVGHTGST